MANLIIQLRYFFTQPRGLTLLFVTWLIYSAGLLGFMALQDATPSHCFSLQNEKSHEN